MNYEKTKKSYLDYVNEINPIGFELKAQREKNGLTLAAISYDIISTSYLCKAENNQAVLKGKYVKDICKRLSIDESKLLYINDSKEKIEKAILAYLLDDVSTLYDLVEEGNGLLNYVYRLIKILYYLKKDMLSDATVELKEIEGCINSINAYDLKYIVAVAIAYDFKTSRLDRAYTGVKALEEMEPTKLLDLFNHYLCFKIFLIWNNPKLAEILDFFKYNPYARSLSYLYAKIQYYYEFSCIKASKDYEIDLLPLSDYPEFVRNLRIFKDYRNKKFTHKPNFKTPIFLCLLYKQGIGADIKEDLAKLDGLILNIDYSKLYLEYLVLPEELKLDFLMQEAIPYVNNTKSDYLKRFFMEEAISLAEKYKRYKLVYQIYLSLFN